MRFILTVLGGFCGVVVMSGFYFKDTMTFEESWLLMFLSLFFLAIAAASNDSTEKNQLHISKQVQETYNKADEAERAASQLLRAVQDMQEQYNEQLQRAAIGNTAYDKSNEDTKRSDIGGNRGYGYG